MKVEGKVNFKKNVIFLRVINRLRLNFFRKSYHDLRSLISQLLITFSIF